MLVKPLGDPLGPESVRVTPASLADHARVLEVLQALL
jgi:hypothetical protein